MRVAWLGLAVTERPCGQPLILWLFDHTSDVKTKQLLVCGAVAGPLFTVAWTVEGATRANYDPLQHPISSLSIGESGWTQAANFIVTSLLTLAFAVGLRRTLRARGGSTWGPLLIGAIAVGLLGAGIFVTDPLNGYPPGTANLPRQHSVPGRLHRLFSALFFLGLPLACFVFARLFAGWGDRRRAVCSAVTGSAFVLMFVVTSAGFAQVEGLVSYAGLFQRITVTIGWAWLTLLAVYMLKAPLEIPTAGRK
jgi:hypothetical protein